MGRRFLDKICPFLGKHVSCWPWTLMYLENSWCLWGRSSSRGRKISAGSDSVELKHLQVIGGFVPFRVLGFTCWSRPSRMNSPWLKPNSLYLKEKKKQLNIQPDSWGLSYPHLSFTLSICFLLHCGTACYLCLLVGLYLHVMWLKSKD